MNVADVRQYFCFVAWYSHNVARASVHPFSEHWLWLHELKMNVLICQRSLFKQLLNRTLKRACRHTQSEWSAISVTWIVAIVRAYITSMSRHAITTHTAWYWQARACIFPLTCKYFTEFMYRVWHLVSDLTAEIGYSTIQPKVHTDTTDPIPMTHTLSALHFFSGNRVVICFFNYSCRRWWQKDYNTHSTIWKEPASLRSGTVVPLNPLTLQTRHKHENA